jgi:hypothetical protein
MFVSRQRYALTAIALLAVTIGTLGWGSASSKRPQLGNWAAAATGVRVSTTDDAPTTPAGNSVHTIRRVWHPETFVELDLGEEGLTPGDTYSFGGPLFDLADKRELGFLSGTCTWTNPVNDDTMLATCQVTSTPNSRGRSLAAGNQITLQGWNDTTPVPYFRQAITGGTQRWRGVRGDVVVRLGAKIVVTFNIIE